LHKHTVFIFQMIALGLALALAGVFMFPQWLGPDQQVVSVREEPVETKKEEPLPQRSSYADAVSKATPAVVNIFTAKKVESESSPDEENAQENSLAPPLRRDPVFAPRLEKQTSLGSGVIVSPRGYILTNNHVVTGAEQIEVLMANGVQLEATVIGADPETDLSLLKVEAENLPTMVIGSSTKLRVGDIVLAIGNPFGVGQTVTQGIISATGRNQLGLNTFEDFIQTDAAINPGSSGGALIDTAGQLVGINTAIFNRTGGSQGIGFAIPVNLARDVMEQIVKNGQVVRGWLGVEGTNVPQKLSKSYQLADNHGVVITDVFPDGPAAIAGLRANDVLLEIDGAVVKDVRKALHLIARSRPGDQLVIRGIRDEGEFEAIAEVSIRPIEPQPNGNGTTEKPDN
jgi:serine protease DegS